MRLSFVVLVAAGLLGCSNAPPRAARGIADVTPPTVDFGVVTVGSTASHTVTLKSSGSGSVDFSSAALTGDAVFALGAASPKTLGAGEDLVLTVRFSPAQPGAFAGRLTLNVDAANTSELLVAVVGQGAAANLCGQAPCTTPPGPCFEALGSCDGGVCSYAPRVGSTCDDGDGCTERDVCDVQGRCVGVAMRCVSDAGPCLGAGRCVAGACVFTSLDAGDGCDDFDACTEGDVCDRLGHCTGSAVTCTSDGGCVATVGTCVSGSCRFAPLDAGRSCDDSDSCTTTDVCDGQGRCVGAPITCVADGGACRSSAGRCVGGACVYDPLSSTTVCDDGVACTAQDRCDGQGRCEGQAFNCLTPAPVCSSASTSRTWSGGQCLADGGCSFQQSDTTCPLGCDADAGQCASNCAPGTHLCAAACVPDTAVGSCGQRCTPCTGAPSNAVNTCDAGQCDFACAAGFLRVQGQCVACDVVVPTQVATVAAAVAAAPSPGVVCLEAGVHAGNVTLRPHVNLRGVGPASVLAGHLWVANLPHANPAPTVVSDLTLHAGGLALVAPCPSGTCNTTMVNAGETFALELARVQVDAVNDGTVYLAQLDLNVDDAGVSISVHDSVVLTERGVRLTTSEFRASTVSLTVERNRFMPLDGGQFTDSTVEFLPGCGATPCPVGTRHILRVANNEAQAVDYTGFYYTRQPLAAPDRPGSTYQFINNTVRCLRTSADAWWENGTAVSGASVTVANNLAFGCAPTLVRGIAPAVSIANLQPTIDPFVDAGVGDLRLAPGSSAVDTANSSWAPADDVVGHPRPVDGNGDGVAAPDVGAWERE